MKTTKTALITSLALSTLVGSPAFAGENDKAVHAALRELGVIGERSQPVAEAIEQRNGSYQMAVSFPLLVGGTPFSASDLRLFESKTQSVLSITSEVKGNDAERVIKTRLIPVKSSASKVIAGLVKHQGVGQVDELSPVEFPITEYRLNSVSCITSYRGETSCQIQK